MTVPIHPDIWFQQDGATSDAFLHVKDWLRNRFGNDIISHRSDFLWPARSFHLSPPDYFLWGDVRERVSKAKPDTCNVLNP